MANHKDFLASLMDMKSLLNKVGGGLLLLALVAGFFIWYAWVVFVLVFLFLGILNCMCVVMPGYAGYLIILGRLWNDPIKSGLRFVVPFISSVTPVDIRLQKHEDEQNMKNADLRDITLKYVLTYKVDPNYVHLLHSTIGEDVYIGKALCPWLDAVMTQIVASKNYEDINGKLSVLSAEVETAYKSKLSAECAKLAGVNLFTNVSVSITEVTFDEEYTKAVSELAKVSKEEEVVKKKAEQLLISKNAQAEARKIEAEAEAEAIKKLAEAEAEAQRVKGASENEVKEKLGIILNEHPELLKEVLARNFPKVYGAGVSPLMNMDDMLK